MEERSSLKKKRKSGAVMAGFFVFSLVIVAIIAFMEFGGSRDRHIDRFAFNYIFMLGAVGCFALALLCETLKYSFLLRSRGYHHKKSLGFTCAVIGKYYDNLTPAGAGGQGFQMYYLNKNGCDSGTSGGLPIIGFLGLQFAFVLVAVLTMILGDRYLGDLVVIRVTAIVGVVFYAFIPACIIFFAIAPTVLEAIVHRGTHLLGRIRIIKHPEEAEAKAIHSLQSYTDALRAFGRNRKQILVVAVTSVIYQCAFMAMPFFVLRFFGAGIGFVECFCRVVYIYAAITIIFTPGNSGAAEASFYMVFDSLQGGEIFWGMLVWRALCYYSWIVIGAVIQIRERAIARREDDTGEHMPLIPKQEIIHSDHKPPNNT